MTDNKKDEEAFDLDEILREQSIIERETRDEVTIILKYIPTLL